MDGVHWVYGGVRPKQWASAADWALALPGRTTTNIVLR